MALSKEVLSPKEVFLRVVHGVCDKRFAELPALYAEDTVVTHPLSPDLPVLRGRAAIAEHFAAAPDRTADAEFQPCDVTVHETGDSEVIVAEFTYRGTVLHGAAELAVPCVFVLRVRDGRIVESRDYADHAAFARARRG